jgi:hypothetical protein
MLEHDCLNHEYDEALLEFRKSVRKTIELHSKVRHLPLQGIALTACLMFARIMLIAGSISRLCPSINDDKSLWDFTSIAILLRALFEAILFFRYFIAPTNPDEWIARLMVLHLHDRCERVRLFEKLKSDKDIDGLQGEARELKKILSRNPFFQTLKVKCQKELLNGSRASILTLSEMGERYSPDNDTWPIYQFLSQYTHSHPVSFMRNDDKRRDGLANDMDKMYLPDLLRWLTKSIELAIEDYCHMPSGLSDEPTNV